MIKITFVAPYEELQQLALSVYQKYYRTAVELKIIKAVGAEIVKDLTFDCDVIIARGVTANAIKSFEKGIPVIELPVTGYDVLRAVHKCQREFNPRKIAIIGSSNMVYGAKSLKEIFNLELECYTVETESEGERAVAEAKKNAAEVIIGGVMTVEIAAGLGLKGILIESGKEAIRQALEEAIRTALIARQEREKAERFRITIEYALEGIVAVDQEGLINIFNQTARKIMNVGGKPVEGRPAERVIPEIGLTEVLKTGEKKLGVLQTIGDTTISTNLVPIKVNNRVTGAVATFQDVTKIQALEGEIRRKLHQKGLVAKYHFSDIIGESKALREAVETAEKFSKVDSNILLLGESGTGKELMAQSIHNASNRQQGPFVAINCAALPPSLLESELFGYVEGAFTGAARGGKPGLFELAHKGTIFLDEVGDISLELQGRLLRVLQEKEIMRIGDDKVIPVDVRVISATNKSLQSLVEEGKFRLDLLFRLDVLRITIPPLRERGADLLLLAQAFLEEYNKKLHKTIKRITPAAQKLLLAHRWPGNIRELRNVCERLSVLANGDEITAADVEKVLDYDLAAAVKQSFPREKKQAGMFPAGTPALSSLEKEVILSALAQTGQNKTKAAEMLGISRTTLWRKIKELHLE